MAKLFFLLQRRWIVVSNPLLCALISKWLGTESWIRDVDQLARLKEYASNTDLQQEWMMVNLMSKFFIEKCIYSIF